MGAPHLDDVGLDLGSDLMGTAVGLGAAIGERRQALVDVAHEPPVNGPAVDP